MHSLKSTPFVDAGAKNLLEQRRRLFEDKGEAGLGEMAKAGARLDVIGSKVREKF